MSRTHAERLARALAELERPCSDEPQWTDLARYLQARAITRKAIDHWGERTP